MIWILLLYVLPYLLCCIVGYYKTKEAGETIGDYLKGILLCLIPMMNIFFLISVVIKSIENNTTIQEFLNKKL